MPMMMQPNPVLGSNPGSELVAVEQDSGAMVSAIGLHETLVETLLAAGRTTLPRLQAIAIPPALLGRDVSIAATPTIEVIESVVIPVIHRLLTSSERPQGYITHAPKAVFLAPNAKVGAAIAAVVQRHSAQTCLRRWVALDPTSTDSGPRHALDILAATPAGLLNLLHRGHLALDEVEVLTLAGFDGMLEPECLSAVGRVIHHLPADRQTLLIHGELPPYAQDLAAQLLREPVCVVADQGPSDAEQVTQGVVHIGNGGKLKVLLEIIAQPSVKRTLVFTRTKHGALAVSKGVLDSGRGVETIHGELSEPERREALARFWDGRAPVMVATDIAVRNMEVGSISHVVNYDLPSTPGDYVARMLRVAPGPASGTIISLCSRVDRGALGRIERHLGDPIPSLGRDLELVTEETA